MPGGEDAELLSKGLAREVTNRVQKLRKQVVIYLQYV